MTPMTDATPQSVTTDDLDDLLGITDDDKPAAPAAKKTTPESEPVVEEPEAEAEEPAEEEEPPAPEEEPDEESEDTQAIAEPEKPKRVRRTKAQIEADNALKAVESMTPEQAEQALLAALQNKLAGTPPKADGELTPVQRQIKAAEDAVARQVGEEISNSAPTYEAAPADDENVLLIHIVNDGLVINGRPVYRGQEFKFVIGGAAYNQTLDTLGRSYLSIADDIDAQYRRWGEQKIGIGPWRGRRSVTIEDAPRELTGEQKQEWLVDMNAHLAAEGSRAAAAPVMRALG